MPKTLTVDNGKQFDSEKFIEFCNTIGTKIAFASVYHPESNGAVERANRAIFSAIAKTLDGLRKGKWAEELPKVIWAHNTNISRATGFTPFRLLYGEEAMLPEEIKHESLRVLRQDLATDEEYSKETIEADRLEAVQNIAKYQKQTKQWRDAKVQQKNIEHGDWVLRRKPNAANIGKLQPKWEGPFIAIQAGRQGSFRLQDRDGNISNHTWNVDNLKKFFI